MDRNITVTLFTLAIFTRWAPAKATECLEATTSLVTNFHAGEFARRIGFRHLHVGDMAVGGFRYVGDVLSQLRRRTFNDHFDRTIGQVFDPAANVVALSNLATGVAEADALDAAGEVDMPALHRRLLSQFLR